MADESARAELIAWLTGACPGWSLHPSWGAALVYRVFSHDETLLYIGMTTDLVTRFIRHYTHSGWLPEARRITIEWRPTLSAARTAETAAIAAEHPKHNRAGTSRDGRLRVNRTA